MRRAASIALVLFAGGASATRIGRQDYSPISDRAREIHHSAIVIDAHEDTAQRFLDEKYNSGTDDPGDPDFFSLVKAQRGNLAAEFFSIWVDPKKYQGHYRQRAIELVHSVYRQPAPIYFLAEAVEEVHDLPRFSGRPLFGALLGVEGGHAIENNLRQLRDFYALGVRYMTLTWNNTNEWADSSGDLNDPTVAHHNGLTPFGKQVVAEMNRLGMIVDISHVSDKTFWDVIATSKAPVIASHSACRTLVDIPRNMSDEMIRAVAKNGGVVAVAFVNSFLDSEFGKRAEQQHEQMLVAEAEYNAKRKSAGQPITEEDTQRFDIEWLSKNKIARAPLKALIDHIDHVVKVGGVEHVGLGSDFDGPNSLVEGIDSAADLPKITQALSERGYDTETIRKILGGNILRVLHAVEQVSQNLRPVQEREPKRIKVTNAFAVNREIRTVLPKYPKEELKNGYGGLVELRVIVATDGKVKEVTPIAGRGVLMAAGEEALRQAEYTPLKEGGKPVEFESAVSFSFFPVNARAAVPPYGPPLP
jgi:membrane dipeptidase